MCQRDFGKHVGFDLARKVMIAFVLTWISKCKLLLQLSSVITILSIIHLLLSYLYENELFQKQCLTLACRWGPNDPFVFSFPYFLSDLIITIFIDFT